jgi:hypothetical protein
MKTFRRYSALFLLMVAQFIFCSCPIPIYYQTKNLGPRIDPSSIKPGISTKKDVFLRFGSTFQEVGDSEKFVMATFAESDVFGLFLFVGAGYSGAVFPVYDKKIDAAYEIEIEFDGNEVVKRCEAFKLPRKQSDDQK